MADKKEVQLASTHLDALMLPDNFSQAYRLYVLGQGANLNRLADKANDAGRGADDAKKRNDEQDKAIAEEKKKLDALSEDYVSKKETAMQSLASPLSAAYYAVNGVQVVGARITGFTPATGSAYKGAFDANKTFSADDVQALADALTETRRRLKALEDSLRTHGLIN